MVSSVGQGADASASTNTGHLLIKLKPTSERRVNAAKIIQQLRHQLQPVPGLRIFLTNPPAISIGGKTTNSHYQYVLQGMDWQSLENAAHEMQAKLAHIPGIEDVDSDLQLNNPELQLHILRDKKAALGITPAQIESTLYAAYGQAQVSNIMRSDGDYQVIMDIDPKYQHSIGSLNNLSIKSSTGNMVPLSDLVTMSQTSGPLAINHYEQLPAITLSFNLQPGYSLGNVTAKVQAVAKQLYPWM